MKVRIAKKILKTPYKYKMRWQVLKAQTIFKKTGRITYHKHACGYSVNL